MSVETVPVYDAIRTLVSSLPHGQAAGYATGSGSIPWGAAEWAAHPGAIRIDQSPDAHDKTADILDVETGAATVADCVPWVRAAAANFAAKTRPGQRHPAIYVNLSNLTPVVSSLAAAKITGVSLWIANWNLTQPQAQSMVNLASGPYPVIGVQYHNAGLYDVSVFSKPWLDAVSGPAVPPPPADPPPPPHPGLVYVALGKVPVLHPGTNDAALPHWYVHRVQAILNGVYGTHLSVDGVYGPASQAAVKALQGHYHLPVTGIVDVKTWDALAAAA